VKEKSTEGAAESRPVWESLEAFARQGVQRLLQQLLEEEVEQALGRRRYERREGLYSSHLVVWRRARGRGELAGLAPRKRGRKPTPVDPRDRKITELERQLAEMSGRAERAEALVDAQKNLAALLGRPGTSARS